MGQLVKNMHRDDVQWWKLKSDYMYKNNMYHLRRTKFVIYQIATNVIGVVNGIGIHTLKSTAFYSLPFVFSKMTRTRLAESFSF